MFLKTFVAS